MTFKKVAMIAAYALAVTSFAWAGVDQPVFKFKPVVRAGDAAPVPTQLSSVLEFAFNDQGQAVLIGDGGILLKSGSQITPYCRRGGCRTRWKHILFGGCADAWRPGTSFVPRQRCVPRNIGLVLVFQWSYYAVDRGWDPGNGW